MTYFLEVVRLGPGKEDKTDTVLKGDETIKDSGGVRCR